MPNGPNATNAEAKTLLEETLDGLERIFEAANSADEKSKVYQAIRAINNELISLEVEMLNKRDEEYRALTNDIKRSTKRLKEIQDKVDDIIASTQTAERIISTLGSAIALITKFV